MLIQAFSIKSVPFERGYWKINREIEFKVGEDLAIIIKTPQGDLQFLRYLQNNLRSSSGVSLSDGELTIQFKVVEIRRILNAIEGEIESIVHVQPNTGMGNNVFTYLYEPSRVEKNFFEKIQSTK